MQRSTKSLLWFVALGSIGAIGYVGYKGTVKVLRNDPLAPLKKTNPDELPKEVAMLMRDTEFRRFESGKPSASCYVKEMRIANNRQIYDLTGITKGQIKWKNKPYQFEAETGNWNGFSKILNVNGKVRLKGPDFDLTSQQLGYDEGRKTLDIPQAVSGIAYGGKLTVASFNYNMDSGAFLAKRGTWVGMLPKEFQKQVPDAKTTRRWDFKFEDVFKKDSVKDVTFYTDAKASDGEIILIAPKMENNDKTDILTATGGVKYFSPKANVLADKIVIYRKEKRAVLIGNVTMLVKPKAQENETAKEETLLPMVPVVPESISESRPPAPDTDEARKKREEMIRSGKNLREYPLMITANQIEYWYKKGERRAKITGNPQARQELPENGWRYVWSFTALYDGEKELLTLESAKDRTDVILKNSLGDEMTGMWGQISTKDGDDSYQFRKGKAKITTRDDDEDLPPVKGSGGTTGGSTGGGGGGILNGPIGRT